MGHDHELVTMSKQLHDTGSEAQSRKEHDAQVLARLGKKPVLERRFGFISICGFTCTILITWEGVLGLFTNGLTNGGSAGLIYGYLFVWVGTIAIFTTMAELASMAPTTGGQYHWMAQLAPPSIRKFMSFIMAWIVICGWMAVLAGNGYVFGASMEAVIQLNRPDYTPQRWQGTLMLWAAVLTAVLINTVIGQLLPPIEAFMLIIHVLGFFAVLIPLVYMAPQKSSAHDVFTVFSNGGNWPTQGLSFFIGLLGSVYSMFGCDSAVHMAEEVRDADVTVPWSMLLTTLLNGLFGFAMVVGVVFIVPDIDEVLSSPTAQLGYPYMQIFYQSTGSKGTATGLIAILILTAVFGTISALATASRLIWALARDRGLPFHRHVVKLQRGSAIPIYAVVIASLTAAAIGLINIGSSAAFNDVISLSVSSLYASYILIESMFLYRRCTGGIQPRNSDESVAPGTLTWGPFHLPGAFGIAVNLFSVLFGIIIFVFSFFPVATPVTPQTMNFSSLMLGSVILFASLYYVLWGRKEFVGPIMEDTS